MKYLAILALLLGGCVKNPNLKKEQFILQDEVDEDDWVNQMLHRMKQDTKEPVEDPFEQPKCKEETDCKQLPKRKQKNVPQKMDHLFLRWFLIYRL